MEPIIHFVSGMPRSGSTLLMNLLAQNPRFGVTTTCGLFDLVRMVKVQWDKLHEFRAIPLSNSNELKLVTLKGMMNGFHSIAGKPIIFDKSRGWVSEIELLEDVLPKPPKILVCVRLLGDILASFEKKFRIAKRLGAVPQEEAHFPSFQTVEGRSTVLLGNNEIVGSAVNRIKDAIARGCSSHMYFVEFERFTKFPKVVMKEIYEFLGEDDFFEHNFEDIKQVTFEDDRVYGWGDLHTIRSAVRPVESDWEHVLSDISPNLKQTIRASNIYWRHG